MNAIDLSHPLIHGQGAYSGASAPEFAWHATFGTKGRTSSVIKMSSHSGTHIDAPLHFFPDGISIDKVPLDRLCGPARIIDVSQSFRSKGMIDPDNFFAAAKDLRQGEIPILYTGVDIHFGKPEFLSQMAILTSNCVQWLVSKGIPSFGTDAYSVDFMDKDDFSNHKILLGAGIPIIEALANLAQLPSRPFLFCALPLYLQDREAAPCRAVAFPDLLKVQKG